MSSKHASTYTPDYFREMADALNAADGGPPDRELLMSIQTRHGLTPALSGN